MKPSPRYTLTLTPLPGNWRVPPIIVRLRGLLKAAKRGYGLKCVDVRECEPADTKPHDPKK